MLIDTRMIKLGKLFVPKTKSFSEYNTNTKGVNNFVSSGYFNYISVIDVNDKDFYSTSLINIQNKCTSEISIPNSDECSYQYVKVFTNIKNQETDSSFLNYDLDTISNFWSLDSLIIFVTMIHIGENHINEVIDFIKNKLSCIEDQYLLYLTFDYSDIIIFAKSDKISEYINLIYSLNFDDNQKLLVEDSYTIYGYEANKYKKLFENNKEKVFTETDLKQYCKNEETISISINLGLETSNYLIDLKNAVCINDKIKFSGMYGRHDISIVNQEADTEWLLFTLMKIDYYSTKSNDKEANGIILYETYLRSELSNDDFSDSITYQPPNKDKFYEKIKKLIDDKFNEVHSELQSDPNEFDKYIIPIHEIKNSTLSVIKNNFAEEFILSMLESYFVFLNKLVQMLKPGYDFKGKDKNETIEEYTNEYFKALNCLVSTVMHTDRQFIQATAFNAVFYDVPPKIVAYYTALINMFKRLMIDSDKGDYVFIFTPNFQTGITLLPLLNFEDPPVDRLFIISIEEKAMYDVESVFRRLAHETAHCASNDSRLRDERQKKLVSAFLYNILYYSVPDCVDFNEETYTLIHQLTDEFYSNGYLSINEYNYSCQFDDLINKLLMLFVNIYSEKDQSLRGKTQRLIFNKVQEHISNTLKNDENLVKKIISNKVKISNKNGFKDGEKDKNYNLNLDIIAKYLTITFFKKVSERFTDFEQKEVAYEDISSYINIFKESYSDLQSIIILNLSFEDYLTAFIEIEGLNVNLIEEERFSDLVRITIISKLMFDTGVWTDFNSQSDDLTKLKDIIISSMFTISYVADDKKTSVIISDINNLLNKSDLLTCNNNNRIEREFETKQVLKNQLFPIWCMYDYLAKCMKHSITRYKESPSLDEINEIRNQYTLFKNFNDISLIIEEINKTLFNYKKYLLENL